jgi:endonuclease/exonuclease/phosphatase family metal-dependent hydrolase
MGIPSSLDKARSICYGVIIPWRNKMKIVSWNCRSTFGKGLTPNKGKEIQKYAKDADFLVIQEINKDECENIQGFTWYDWTGDRKDGEPGGVVAFSREGYNLEKLSVSKLGENLRYVVPYRVTGKHEFTLLTVWTKGKPYDYTETILLAVYEYQIQHPAIIIGDFNTASLDNKDLQYSNLATGLNYKGFLNCDKSEMPSHTFFRGGKQFVNDYCFASEKLAESASLEVINADELHDLSDHCPIIVDLEFNQ